MKKIINWIKRVFWYFVIINVEKYKIDYWQFNSSSIKEVENMYKNTIAELYLKWHKDGAEVVAKQLTAYFIDYNNTKNVRK